MNTGLVSTPQSAGVSVDMAAYTAVDNDAATRRSVTAEALIEGVRHQFSVLPEAEETTSEDTCKEVAPVTHNEADAAISV